MMRFPFNKMKRCCGILIRPLFFLIFLVLAFYMLGEVCLKINQFEQIIVLQADKLRYKAVKDVENAANTLPPLNSSALKLATVLSAKLNGTDLTFHVVQTNIAPALFQALTTIPRVTEVGFMGLDQWEFYYYHDHEQTYAVFSNGSSPNSIAYTQPVNRDNGKLFGTAVVSNSTIVFNSSGSVNDPGGTQPYPSLEVGKNQDLLIKSKVPMDGRGHISIGFPADEVKNQFSHLDFHESHLHLASNDGQVLLETKFPDVQISVDNGTYSLMLKKEKGDYEVVVSNVSCNTEDDSVLKLHHKRDDDLKYKDVKINEKKHKIVCSTVNIAGIDSVYVLAFPSDGIEAAAYKSSMVAIVLLVLMLVGSVVSLCLFIFLILRAARREIVLCDALIKQKESTQQAERKSMSKTDAFAAYSHDLRASLAAITCSIELCREDAMQSSHLATKLSQIDGNVHDLLGLLNTVLDKSRIEAGKTQLIEEEFDLAQVLEDVVNMHYPVGIKKGIDVMLDHCDGSILKSHIVKGDKVRLKQILENLLTNGIKFTTEGHIVIRCLVRKTSNENAIIVANRRSILKCLSRFCYKSSGSLHSLDEIPIVHENPNCMEFVFEVDDTGCGIPKERQQSVFENYVQVTPAASQQGCGLGLGIVQSLVRLMGGEIRIIDKENGERGTCFRFNVFLTVCNPVSTDIDEHGNHNGVSSSDYLHYLGLHIRSPPTRLEASHVILVLAGKERRKVSKRMIENIGIRVTVAERSKELKRILDKMREKIDHLQQSLSEKSECSLPDNRSTSSNSNSGLNSKACIQNSLLIVIDAVAGPALEVSEALSSFKKQTRNLNCEVVWWDNPINRRRSSRDLKEEKLLPHGYYRLTKPLHGSGLYEVLALLPEFQGPFLPDSLIKLADEVVQEDAKFSSSKGLKECNISADDKKEHQLQEIVVHDPVMLLKGKSVLVVDDVPVLSTVASTSISKLGARVEVCKNGKEAYDKVCKVLNDEREIIQEATLPYDYIIMDCEMPVMDGYEATRLIREEEKLHGTHIPIFALTAHGPEGHRRVAEAGMDVCLSKPFRVDKLLDAIRDFECKPKH